MLLKHRSARTIKIKFKINNKFDTPKLFVNVFCITFVSVTNAAFTWNQADSRWQTGYHLSG